MKSALCLDDFETAFHWITKDLAVRGEISKKLPAYLDEVRQITFARVDLSQGNLDRSLKILDRIQPQVEAAGREAHLIDISLLKAIIYQKKFEPIKAIDAIKAALLLAASDGFRRIFLDGSNDVMELIQMVAHQDFTPQFVNNLLADFDEQIINHEPILQTIVHSPNRSMLVEPLSKRECEVLKLIAAGHTNREIANTLVISLNTVKKHTTHICGKMGVKNRTQAIAKAREIKLIF